jgi:hypothetical protein
MKYLLVISVLALAGWVWWSGRSRSRQTTLIDMVRCPVCAVHLLRSEATQGDKTWYCCTEHWRKAER